MKHLILLLVAVLICGCQAPMPVQKLDTTRVFQSSYDKVWPVLVQTASAQDYPLKIVQKDSGIIETDNFAPGQLSGSATAPRGLFLPLWGDTRARLSILARPDGTNSTFVNVVGHFEGFEYNGTHQWYIWNSTGQFENQFLSKVESSLK